MPRLKVLRPADDGEGMRWCVRLLLPLLVAVGARAQERLVTVQLVGGEVLQGAVVAMDPATLQVRVADRVVTIPAERIVQCRFTVVEPALAEPAAEAAPPPPPPEAKAKTRGAARTSAAADAVPIAAGDDAAGLPVDAVADRHSLFHDRLAWLGRAHPWLLPTAFAQGLSLALVLAILASLGIWFSVRVAGAESPTFTRSFGLAVWYLVTALLQLAIVPPGDLSLAVVLLANPAMALFWLTTLFGLSRPNAVVALAVQVGFAVLGGGVAALVTAVLAATTPAA
jgi:hypothetical protein